MTIRICYPTRFDYDFRPASYFQDLDPETLIVTSILGEERRKDVQRRLASGGVDPELYGEWLTDSKLDNSTRQVLGRMHPTMMGGEYLPSIGQQEIEIARIVLASTTQDVISIRARRTPKFIAYRVVDEYETEYDLAKHRSAKPLTLRELIKFINRTNRDDQDDADRDGLVFSVLAMNLDAGSDPESMRGFVSVHSSFYPDLGRYFEWVTEVYLDERFEPDDGVDDDADEEEEPSLFAIASQRWDLQRLPEDPAIRPMLIGAGVPRQYWPDGFISAAQADELIKQHGN